MVGTCSFLISSFWACACKLSWTLFSPAPVQPYMGREERRVQGLDYISRESRETLRFEGNKIHCSQSLSDLLYSKTKQKQIWKNALRFQQQHQVTSDHVQQRSRGEQWILFPEDLNVSQDKVNISRIIVSFFPFGVIVFAMLPAHGIWRETVSLLDVMWP